MREGSRETWRGEEQGRREKKEEEKEKPGKRKYGDTTIGRLGNREIG